MDYRERGSRARGVYITQSIRVKQEEETDKRVVRNVEERNVGTDGKSSKQDLTSAEDLTIELPEGHESPYHRLD